MDILFEILGSWGIIILGLALIIIAYLGSVLPALPGTPFAALAVFLVHFALPKEEKYSWITLTIVIFLTLAISLVDYILPIWGTKRYGGSKSGVTGSMIGLIVGVLLSFISGGLGMIAIFAGPFFGAYLGEKYFAKADNNTALKSAWGSLVGFLAGTLGKFIVVTIISIIFVFGAFHLF